jgi:hypothetical protein
MDTTQMNMGDAANSILMALKSLSDTGIDITDSTNSGICMDSTSMYYLLDSNMHYTGMDSLDMWWQNIGALWTFYDRVGFYNSLGQVSIADSIFRATVNFLAKSSLSDSNSDSSVYAIYSTLWSVLKTAESEGRTIFSLDSADKASLEITSDPDFTQNSGELAMWIINITHGGIVPISPLPIPCIGSAVIFAERKENNSNPKNNQQNGYAIPSFGTNERLSVYPNPSSGIITFAYNVSGGGSITIIITDMLGEKVAEMQPGTSSGLSYWDPRGNAAGMYIYRVSNGEGIIGMGKVVVVSKQ